jgi:hypothetical protein
MLEFCDGRAKAIGSPKGMNEFKIVIKRVLLRKIEVIMNTACLKDFPMMIKSLKGIVQGSQAVCFIYCVKLCRKTPERHALPAPYHLVHGLQLLVDKPAHKFATSA